MMVALTCTRLLMLAAVIVPISAFTIRHSGTATAGSANSANDGMSGSPFTTAGSSGAASGGLQQGPFTVNGGSGGTGSGYFGMNADHTNSAGSGRDSNFSPLANNAGTNGASPFAVTDGKAGSSPFSTASGNGRPATGNSMLTAGTGMGGSSAMTSGPGGLMGGNFLQGSDSSALIGHNYLKDMTNDGYMNSGSESGQGNVALLDTTRFNTDNYENMLKDMFNPGSVGEEIERLGNPFNGNSYDLSTNQHDRNGHIYDTSKEASVGSYASTRIDSHAWNGGGDTDRVTSQQLPHMTSGSYNTASPDRGHTSSSSSYQNPFDVRNYDNSQSTRPSGSYPSTSSNTNNADHGSSPFNVANFAKSPFSTNNNDMNSGPSSSMNSKFSGNSPFDVNTNHNSNGNKNTETGQGPFNVNNFASMGGTGGQGPFNANRMTGTGSPFNANSGTSPFSVNTNNNAQRQFNSASQNVNGRGTMDTGTAIKTGGSDYQFRDNGHDRMDTLDQATSDLLDQFGNIDFGSLSGLISNGGSSASSSVMDTALSGSYSDRYSYNTDNGQRGVSSSDQNHYNMPTNSYTDMGSASNTASSDYGASSGYSSSQYKTPFESDNYNDLIGNPFQSENYFDNNEQNFKTPYEDRDSVNLRSGQPEYREYGGQSGTSGGGSMDTAGPGGNPYQQGGHSLGSNSVMRG